MRGEPIGMWAETWRKIWLPLIEQPLAEDIFCKLSREVTKGFKVQPLIESLADIVGDSVQSRGASEKTTAAGLRATCDRHVQHGGNIDPARWFHAISHPRAQPRHRVSEDMR